MKRPAGDSFSIVEGGLRLAVRLTPKAGRNAVQGIVGEAEGQAVLLVSVTAPPVDGKANAALVALLAELFAVPKSAIGIVAGAAARRKTLFVAGDGEALRARLAALPRRSR